MSAALQLVHETETADLQAENSILIQRASAIVISDDASYADAVAFMNDVAARKRAVIEKFREPKQKAHDAHKSICALERELLDVIEKAEREAKRRIAEYREDQERRVAAERQRLEDEARRREEDRRIEEALYEEDAGNAAAAMAIIAEPITPVPVRAMQPTPKVARVQFREDWTFALENIVDVARHVAAHPEDACLLALNTTAVRQMVRARKSLFRVPGIRAYAEKTVAAGGGRRS